MCLEDVLRVSGWCQEGVRRVSGGYLSEGQVRIGQAKTGKVRTGQVLTGQIWTVKVGKGQEGICKSS